MNMMPVKMNAKIFIFIDDACLVRVGADLLGNAESDTVLLA